MTQSTYFNQVKNVLKVLQGYTKGIRFLLVMFLTLSVSAEVWGADVVYKTAKFGSSYNSVSVSSYTSSWYSTYNGFRVDIVNANNNQNGWSYIKMGSKNAASTGTITTNAKIDAAITKVSLKIDAITTSKITSITLKTATSSNGTYTSVGTFTKVTGTQTVTLVSPTANLFYKIEVVCTQGSSNGLITISQVDYYIESSTPAVPVDPEVTFSDGEYTVGGAALNLSTLLTTNSTGAVTYSVTNAGTTGATINGTSFTATAAGTCTVQASQAATASHNAITKTATITVNAPAGGGGGEGECSWVETAISSIKSTDIVVITMTNSNGTYAMSNSNGTSSAPTATDVTVSGTTLTGNIADNLKWNISNSNGTLTIYPNETTEKWLYCTNTNNGVRVGTGNAKGFTISSNYLYTNQTSDARYLGVYNDADWRCYTSINNNITGQTLKFYVYQCSGDVGDDPEPVIVKTLKSIAVTGMTTTFEQGDVFKFDGTCTATYSVTKDGAAQADETAEVTPTNVSTPNMNQIGTQTVYVTYSEGGVEKTDDYEITITENTVTAGEYCITPNNEFWGTNFSGSITSDALNQTYIGRQDDITIQYAKGSGSSLYINASQTRTYNGTVLTFSVPSGYLITAIAFTADGNNWDGTHTANAGSMTDSKNWAGSANEVTITFGGTCRITNICVTYEAIDLTLPSAPTFNPEAGTYNAVQNVTISAEAGTTIYYTLDGTDPTTASDVYASAIEIAETKTLKAIAVKDEKISPVASATYTINLPLTTMDQIFAKATAVGSTATSVEITFDNWVVSAVKEDGKTAFVTDGTKGFAIFDKDLNLGFSVGNILSGTVACEVQLYNGFAELTALTSATTGLNVTTGGTITTQELDATAIEALTGVNTGSLIKINGTCTSESSKYYVAGVQIYTSLYDFGTLEVGTEYNITGIYQQFHSTKDMLPRSAEDIEEIQEPLTTYNVNWLVNGDEWADSESVKEGTKITSLPEDPTDECGGKTFVGWSNQEVTDGNKPAVLFTDAVNSPTIADNTTFHAVFATPSDGGILTPELPRNIVYWEKQKITANEGISATTGSGTMTSNVTLSTKSNRTYQSTINKYAQIILSDLNLEDYTNINLSFWARGSQEGSITIKTNLSDDAITTFNITGTETLYVVNNIPASATSIILSYGANSGSLFFGTVKIYENTTITYPFTKLTEDNTNGWTGDDWDGYYLITNAQNSLRALDGNSIGEKSYQDVIDEDGTINASISMAFLISSTQNGFTIKGVGDNLYLATGNNSISVSSEAEYYTIGHNKVEAQSSKLSWNIDGPKFGFYGVIQTSAPQLYKIMRFYSDYTTSCLDVNWTITEGGSLSTTSGITTTVIPNEGYTYGEPAYTITDGSATVTQNGNIFTAVPTTDCTIQINMVQKTTYTVTWMVNGKEYTEGTPSTTVYADERVATLPTPPEPNAYCGDVFVGWTTENPASGNFDEAPTIYNEQSAFPPATDNQTFYAVFADYEQQ